MNLRRHVTYANLTATLALVVALGGTSYAATLITSAQIKDKTIQNVDVKPGTLTGGRVKDHSIGVRDLANGATTRANSSFHDAGVSVQNQVGGNDPLVLSLTIPKKGNYVVLAKTWLQNTNGSLTVLARCRLYAETDFDQTRFLLEANTSGSSNYQSTSLQVVHHFSAPGQAELRCYTFGVSASANDSKITAIKVDTLTNTSG